MKFFTKDRYLQHQVMVNFFCPKDEKDYTIKKEYWQRFFSMNPFFFNYLPESIRKSVYDTNTNEFVKFLPPNLITDFREWQQNVLNESEDIFSEYQKYFEKIKNELPKSVIDMNKSNYFHDAQIAAVKVCNSSVNIELEYIENYSLTFTGVKLLEKPDQIIGDRWIYDELHLSEKGNFDLQVLLLSPEGCLNLHELRIIADDVVVSKLD